MKAIQTVARNIVHGVEQKRQQELEAKEQELADKVAKATLEQLRAKIEADFELLKKYAPSPSKDALEAARDCKYLKERQMTPGSEYWFFIAPMLNRFLTEELWGFSHCVLMPVSFFGSRSRRGQKHVKTWMEQRFRVTLVAEAETMTQSLGTFGKLSSELAEHGEPVLLSRV